MPTIEQWEQSVAPLVNPECPDETPAMHEMPDGTTVRFACMTNGVVFSPPFGLQMLADLNWPDSWNIISGG